MTDKDKNRGEQGAEGGGPEQVEAFEPLPGDLLREARTRRGWTPARVAEDMNLEARFVEAMEDNRFEDLGAPVFARGHLRKYANLLEVDTERLMKAYAVIEHERMSHPTASAEGLAMSGAERPGRGRWRGLVILLALSALAALAWRLLSSGPDAGPTLGDDRPAPVVEEEARATTARDDIDEPVAVPLPVIVTPDEEPPSAAATERGQTPDSESISVATAPVETPPLERAPEPAGVSILLRFEADSWVEVRDVNGNRLIYQLGRAGRQRSATGTPPFDIFLGFADGVSIELDGEPVSIPSGSRLGRTARFRLPIDSTAATIRP